MRGQAIKAMFSSFIAETLGVTSSSDPIILYRVRGRAWYGNKAGMVATPGSLPVEVRLNPIEVILRCADAVLVLNGGDPEVSTAISRFLLLRFLGLGVPTAVMELLFGLR